MNVVHSEVSASGKSDIDGNLFRNAMGELPGGVVAITCVDGDGTLVGATLSAVTSLSLDPPMLLACFGRESRTLSALQARDEAPFAVHVLSSGQERIASQLASKDQDKFDKISWRRGFLDVPEIDGAVVTARCTVHQCFDGGDHVVVTGRIHELKHDAERLALLYHRSKIRSISELEDVTP